MNRIREVRDAADIKQAALCNELGWIQSRLSNYETGNRSPGLQEARQIVGALNRLGAECSLSDVFPEPSEDLSVA